MKAIGRDRFSIWTYASFNQTLKITSTKKNMKTVFDKQTRDELIQRINTIDEHKTAQWGKMNVYQMLKHCTIWEDWVRAEQPHQQAFIGRLFGRMALKKVLKDDSPFPHSTPTLPILIIKEQSGDIESEKRKWVAFVEQYANYTNPVFVHTFFGKMTREQVGQLAYKHNDHHLRQFNC